MASPVRAQNGVPSDFGAPGGTAISNKATVLSRIDQVVGTGKPPALELIYCDSGVDAKVGPLSSASSPFGHLSARYTMPDGVQKVFNVVGRPPVSPLRIAFSQPDDYFFGTGNYADTNGGIYNRSFYTLRIESLPPEQLAELDAYYSGLAERGEDGTAKFDLLTSDIKNAVDGGETQYGNCALWTSRGLQAAGLLQNLSMWPKEDWARLYEKMKAQDPNNVHVVAYHSVPDSVRSDGMGDQRMGPAAPWDPVMSTEYWSLDKLADVVVDVPPGSTEANVSRR